MIVKKVKVNPRMPKSKAAHILDLTDYIEREDAAKEEKVLYVNGCNFLSTDYAAQQVEMMALAGAQPRSRHPVTHWILSWREGEQPSFEQTDDAVRLFLDELGLKDHQALYALHRNTDNVHLHIAVNRVHPDTYRAVEVNHGFDREAAHRALARIEQAHGWQREQAGRYRVLENGEVARAPAQERRQEPAQRQRDREHRTGEKSAMRIASEQAAPVIQQAQTWEQLHERLAAVGMRYERKGSGAILWVGDTAIKASQADRRASLLQLEKRLGAYRPALPHTLPESFPKRPPEPVKPNVPGWSEYIASRKAHYADKDTTATALRTQHEQERQALYAEQKAQREYVLAGRWRGQGALLNALRSTTAAQQAMEKAELKERQQQAWQAHRQRFQRFPDLEEWLRQRSPEQAAQWRYRLSEPALIRGERFDRPTPRDIRAFAAEVHGWEVHYTRQDEAARGGRVSFVDQGRQIKVYDWNDRASALAALQLAAQKWGGFTVEGRDEYKALCAELAAEHGFRITNPELQDAIHQERQRIREARQPSQREIPPPMPPSLKQAAPATPVPPLHEMTTRQAMPRTEPRPASAPSQRPPPAAQPRADASAPTPAPENTSMPEFSRSTVPPIPPGPLPQFERYHEAVNADRYRVTSIKMYPDGGKQTFILDKQDGVTRGFTPAEIESRTPEMQRLQRRGENLYYTPLSEDKHHLLIDDLDRSKLERLIQDGYQPAVVLESSPGNYQAIITIPKLGTPHDKEVGNRLAEQLNREYGDPKLSGCIHPHRAPGYENRKPKHQREDGSYPEVRLLRAERRECDRTRQRARQIDAEYQRQAQEKAERQAQQPRPALDIPAAAGVAVAAYQAHYRDVLPRTGGADLSRVDALIAVRMRVTGHSQADIAGALRQCAPAIREAPESRNWEDYAQRIARYAFSLPADRQAATLEKYRDHWITRERRQPQRAPERERHHEIERDGPELDL